MYERIYILFRSYKVFIYDLACVWTLPEPLEVKVSHVCQQDNWRKET